MASKLLRRVLLAVLLICTTLWALLLYGPISPSSWPTTKNSSLDYHDYGDSEEDFNCSAIIKGDPAEVENAKLLSITEDFRNKVKLSEEYFVNATKDCSEFILRRKYLRFPLSKEEEEFPLAFTIVAHHKVQSFELLLRAIYAPQNVYCVNVDQKVKPSTLASFESITSCFPNVFMVSRPVRVTYAGWSRVQADINCMSDLYNVSTPWKYLINLCGQDFPIKTNLEMVRSLRALGGRNSVNSQRAPPEMAWRWTIVHEEVDGVVKKTNQERGPPPFNIPLYLGSAYIIVSRGYIHSVLTDSRIQALIEWFKGTYSPDENLWASIQRMEGVPGWTRPHPRYDLSDMNAVARLVRWQEQEGQEYTAAYPPCQGHHVRYVCVNGLGDLAWILEQHHFFANKFDIDMDYISLHCLDQHLRQKALIEAPREELRELCASRQDLP